MVMMVVSVLLSANNYCSTWRWDSPGDRGDGIAPEIPLTKSVIIN